MLSRVNTHIACPRRPLDASKSRLPNKALPRRCVVLRQRGELLPAA